MDYGESEAVILYKELKANYLLIDDKKARDIAENFGIQCIGTIGILSIARERKMIDELKTLFEVFLQNKRYYSLKLLNAILKIHDEEAIKQSI
jgi:predicted nucleic acid-binding protein